MFSFFQVDEEDRDLLFQPTPPGVGPPANMHTYSDSPANVMGQRRMAHRYEPDPADMRAGASFWEEYYAGWE